VIACSEAMRQLWEYLDQAVSPEDQEKVEQHLSFCRRCCGELEFAKQLRGFLGGHPGSRGASPACQGPAGAVRGRPLGPLGRDLMFQQEIKETVQRAYAAIATDGGERVTRRRYGGYELAEVPPGLSSGPLGWTTPFACS
jgi:hypothetical protein